MYFRLCTSLPFFPAGMNGLALKMFASEGCNSARYIAKPAKMVDSIL